MINAEGVNAFAKGATGWASAFLFSGSTDGEYLNRVRSRFESGFPLKPTTGLSGPPVSPEISVAGVFLASAKNRPVLQPHFAVRKIGLYPIETVPPLMDFFTPERSV